MGGVREREKWELGWIGTEERRERQMLGFKNHLIGSTAEGTEHHDPEDNVVPSAERVQRLFEPSPPATPLPSFLEIPTRFRRDKPVQNRNRDQPATCYRRRFVGDTSKTNGWQRSLLQR